MAAINLDLSQWPAVVTTPPKDAVHDDEMADYLETYGRLIEERGGAYASVVDIRGHPGITPTQRSQITAHMTTMEGRRGATCVGTALVFDSALLRGVLTAIFWVKKPEFPIKVFPRVSDAVRWARQQAARHEEGSRRLA